MHAILTSALFAMLFVAIAFISLVAAIATIYNRLVKIRTECENAFAQIEVQLKRRYDLIPNLVECVKRYMLHERETLEQVMAARNQAAAGLARAAQQPGDAEALRTWMGAEGSLAGALGKLSV